MNTNAEILNTINCWQNSNCGIQSSRGNDEKTWKIEDEMQEKIKNTVNTSLSTDDTRDKHKAEIKIIQDKFNTEIKIMRDTFKCEIVDIKDTHEWDRKY